MELGTCPHQSIREGWRGRTVARDQKNTTYSITCSSCWRRCGVGMVVVPVWLWLGYGLQVG